MGFSNHHLKNTKKTPPTKPPDPPSNDGGEGGEEVPLDPEAAANSLDKLIQAIYNSVTFAQRKV